MYQEAVQGHRARCLLHLYGQESLRYLPLNLALDLPKNGCQLFHAFFAEFSEDLKNAIPEAPDFPLEVSEVLPRVVERP